MYMWRDFDVAEVRDELEHVADMGFDTVRLFALAQDFLPERELVDRRMISRLVEVARAAKNAGLSSCRRSSSST
jgi:endo-1,4-beta-mannosidase